jgi:polyadenylate-binding protein
MQRQSLGNNLYVRNFDADFKDENLNELFSQYGEIRSCRVMRDEKENSRGFGFVSFVTAEQANTALREMNGRMLNGKPLMVNIAQRRDQRYSMLQVQFQQRIQAMMRQLPMVPFVAGNQARRPMRGPGGKGQAPLPPHRMQVGRGRGGAAQEAMLQASSGPYTVPRTPQQSPAIVPETPPLAPITAEDLTTMSLEDQKTALGERLYVKISDITPDYAPKITGMLLEMEPMEALSLLDNPAKLNAKVEEALCVLRAHEIERK